MIIKEIELNNFRIYKGVNTIDLTPDGDRNIIIVSGNNGFGKTTFLMSLVWCLYGRQMDKVDDLYRKEIEEKGGYSKYIGNSLNIQAKKEGETRFSVSVTFTDVEIPDVPCTDIKITRSYDSATNYDDELEIFIDGRKSDLFSGTKEKEILSKKIAVSNQNKAVDDEASRLIRTIQQFLIKFKDEKKKALAKKLEDKLKKFLHKTNLVDRVVVDINGNGDDVDINLYDADSRKIDKGNLSMGERQMFASALLGALVDETEIEFPVFIDSPMQKFDTSHTRNILTQFYPNVSKQVILFPLLMKELTEDEYRLIQPIVSKAYLIDNQKNGSRFLPIQPDQIFMEYKNRNYAN